MLHVSFKARVLGKIVKLVWCHVMMKCVSLHYRHTPSSINQILCNLLSSAIGTLCDVILAVIFTSLSFVQTLIEATADIKTTDGYYLRLFCIGFTKKQPNQIKKTCYAKSSQIRNIRRKMVEIMSKEVSTVDLKEVVNKL